MDFVGAPPLLIECDLLWKSSGQALLPNQKAKRSSWIEAYNSMMILIGRGLHLLLLLTAMNF